MHLIHSSPACAVKTTVIMLQCVAAVAAALTADDRALLRAKAGVYASPERAYVVGGAAAFASVVVASNTASRKSC